MCEGVCTHFCVHAMTALFCSESDPVKNSTNFFQFIPDSEFTDQPCHILFISSRPFICSTSPHSFITVSLFFVFSLNQSGHLHPDPQCCAKKYLVFGMRRVIFCEILASSTMLCHSFVFFLSSCNLSLLHFLSPYFAYLHNNLGYLVFMCLQAL